MIIGLAGFGNSGASAVLDYLKEYDSINIYDQCEFQILHEIDGIEDLKYYLTKNRDRIACNGAIKRFLKMQKYGALGKSLSRQLGDSYKKWYESYIASLTCVKWVGEESSLDPCDISDMSLKRPIYLAQRLTDILLKKINKEYSYPLKKNRYFAALSENEFDCITKKYLIDLFGLLGLKENSINVLDMLFSFTNPILGMEFFEESKAIVVNRDPRDVYVSSKLHPEDSRFMPNQDVHEFICYYKKLQEFHSLDERILNIRYEDLIYKYDETCSNISNFLSINKQPEKEFEMFDPTFSVRYTNRVELYKNYADDIKIIESELKKYLYPFNEVSSPINDSNLNKRKENVKYRGFSIK